MPVRGASCDRSSSFEYHCSSDSAANERLPSTGCKQWSAPRCHELPEWTVATIGSTFILNINIDFLEFVELAELFEGDWNLIELPLILILTKFTILDITDARFARAI